MELFIVIVLLVVAVETTYLVAQAGRRNGRLLQAPVFVDTSVLIDGRIIAIATSGFVARPLYIPRSVVGELQFLADNGDSEKRSRARHGLDVITELQAIESVTVRIFNDGVRAKEGVDNRLLELAKKNGGAICTIDYNLNKVAAVEGIEVLNVNELAKSLRMAYLPGEHMVIELTQKGNDAHQGVGHLDDGTMVVVEHAHKYIGTKVEIEFIRSLQTAAGKMMFAKLVPSSVPKAKTPRQGSSQQAKPARKAATVKSIGRKAPSGASGTASATRNTNAVQAHSTTAPSSKASRGKRSTARRSPEDSLVELANRS